MGPLDAFWHLVNFGALALLAAGLTCGVAKLCWRADLKGVSWVRLTTPAFMVALVVQAVALILGERDGLMASYAAMVLAMACTLWWVGFRRR